MNLACPECHTVYRIDPARVPAGGVVTRCRRCQAKFRVDPDAASAAGTVTTAEPESAPPEAGAVDHQAGEPAESSTAAPSRSQPAGVRPAFGPQDPDTRARRLARALVSDIKVYNPEKWEESKEKGTLRREFRDEILKSWDEYLEQVGEEMAKKTPYFRDALNDILAAGERVF